MKNYERVIWGILLTAIVFIISVFIGEKIQLNNNFIPQSFVADTLMLILAIGLIWGLRKHVNYKISLPKFKETLRPMLFGFLAAVIISVLMTVVGTSLGLEIEIHHVFDVMSPLQFILFVFIYASVVEEVLFRGFLQNILTPLNDKGIQLFKRHISIPVIVSALAFSLAHLNLIRSDAGAFFLVRTLIFTFSIGLVAGYYQEKHNNNAYAILVHMAANFMGVIAAFLMSSQAAGI